MELLAGVTFQIADRSLWVTVYRWSVPHVILTWTLAIFFVWRLATFGLSVPRLLELKRFYEFLLNVPDVSGSVLLSYGRFRLCIIN